MDVGQQKKNHEPQLSTPPGLEQLDALLQHRSRRGALLLFVLALQFSQVQADEPKPAAAQGDDQSPQICQPRIRTYPAITYFFTSKETTFNQLQATIQELMPAVEKAIAESKAQIVGPPV